MWLQICTTSRMLLFLGVPIVCLLILRSSEVSAERSTKIYRDAAAAAAAANEQTGSGGQQRAEAAVYLESLDDLEHVAYLAMRNFNMTDESLINQLNLGGNVKQHQKVVATSKSSTGAESNKDRLALMLESFILHLRNGHLRQLSLEELRYIVNVSQQTQTADNATGLQQQTDSNYELIRFSNDSMMLPGKISSSANESLDRLTLETVRQRVRTGNAMHNNVDPLDRFEWDESDERCDHLVSLYVETMKLSSNQQQQQQLTPDVSSSTNSRQQSDENAGGEVQSQTTQRGLFNRARLLKLCRLVVRCHSADELVGLLDGPWQVEHNDRLAGREFDQWDGEIFQTEPVYVNYPSESRNYSSRLSQQRRNLRDSLSQSLAKLCPLMLFQLHDEDGMCSFRRDDRPPMVTVWGFATLFVTIVSFVSLIGLSITPLLGTGASRQDQTSTSSSSSELSVKDMMQLRQAPGKSRARANKSPSGQLHPHSHPHPPQQHKACLTLFEGLAVGSLVGSALFSLIPQAFELQERESNRGFLLKALIIFFGIYLFFCSERIMRIVLDTRQHRKRKRRGSNLTAPPSTTVDNLVGFATSTTGCSALQQQPMYQVRENHHRQRSNLTTKQFHQNNRQATALQVPSGRVSGEQLTRNSTRPSCRLVRSAGSEQIGRQPQLQPTATNKSVTFPASEAGRANSCKTYRSGSRHRERRMPTDNMDLLANLASKSRAERRQAARRHQTRTRHSTKAAGRRQKRKTRYQLLVQSKRLHSDSLTLRRDLQLAGNSDGSRLGDKAEADAMEQRLSLRSCNSLPSDDDSVPSELDSPVHESGSLADENYDSTTSLDSSFSNSDSDDDSSRLGSNQRWRQQKLQNMKTNPMNCRNGWPRSPSINDLRRLAYFPMQEGNSFEMNPLSQPTNQAETLDRQASDGRPSSAMAQSQSNEKQEISTVAWMIVLGDGLHNFIDGISIGAAFSESILSGVSISVAIICEEFPHELGDFAVLVSSGMTVRQALGYNFLSACTCYLGMAVGIILGDVNDGASYISALAAGVFLYIALVDMMGELSASLEESSRNSIGKTLKLLLLQNVGIFIGISIILVLSFIDF